MTSRTPLAQHLHDLAADLLETIWRYEAERRVLTSSERAALERLDSRVAWLKALAAKHAADADDRAPAAEGEQ